MTRAVVATEVGAPLEVAEVTLAPLGDDDVRVEIVAAGVCHSDRSLSDGTIACELPMVLGHEAAGVITELGAKVSGVRTGDHVVLNWAPPCRTCFFCLHGEPWLCERNAGVASVDRGVRLAGSALQSALGVGAFCEELVLPSESVVAIPTGLAFDVAAVMGCAVLTGLGAVVRTGGVEQGDSVAVFGLGGVGLSALAGARVAGAGEVIAIDRSADKEDLARIQGATEFVLADAEVARRIRALTAGRGADHVFDCVGSAETIRAAWSSARRGGHVTVVGVGSRSEQVTFNPLELFYFARTLDSSIFGSSDPARDIPTLVGLVLDGSVDLAQLITHRGGLDEVSAAFERMTEGIGGRTVIEMQPVSER